MIGRWQQQIVTAFSVDIEKNNHTKECRKKNNRTKECRSTVLRRSLTILMLQCDKLKFWVLTTLCVHADSGTSQQWCVVHSLSELDQTPQPFLGSTFIGGSKEVNRDAPTGGPNSFIFMQFSAKKISWHTHFGSWRSPQENHRSATNIL